MGWLDWIIGAALTAAAAWLIAESVSYFITKKNLRQLLLKKKNESNFQNAAAAMIRNNTGHEISFDMFDEYNNNLGGGKVSSSAGVSSDIHSGDVILL